MTKSKWINRIVGHDEIAPDQLLANPLNYRIHPAQQQSALSGSLDNLGWIQEVLVNKNTGHVIDGHLRIQLALRNDEKLIPVTYLDLTEDEERLALLSLDPIAAMAATDKEQLETLLSQVNSDDQRVQEFLSNLAKESGLSYGEQEQGDAEPQIDKAEELQKKWGVQTGDLYRIGEHRLLCGDSTKREDVERVMGGEKADACITDPPYGVLEEEWDRPFLQSDLDMIFSVTDGLIACFNAAKTDIVFRMLSLSPMPERIGVWRHSQIMPRPGMIWSWQPVFYWNCKEAKAWDSLDWYQGNSDKDRTHPTQKPVEFFEKIIGSVSANILYEPFCGSGTTMVACQNLSRKCRAIEISPKYCAVILQRMTDAFQDIIIEKLE